MNRGASEPTQRRTSVEATDARSGPHTAPHDQLLTPVELATRWQVRQQQVWRLAREGGLPVVYVGRYMRFALSAVEEWERNGGSRG